MVEIWLPYGRSEIPVRIPEERLLEVLRAESANPITDPVAEAERLLQSNEQFQAATNEAPSAAIVLGSCGSRQLATDLTHILLNQLSHSQGSVTIILTAEAIDTGEFGDAKVVKHTSESESTPFTDFQGAFTPDIDSAFVKSDLRVLIGELRPHHFLRYSGLCDLVFPQLAPDMSIRRQLADRPGVTLDNLHDERVAIASSFHDLYALGLTLDAGMRLAKMAFGGITDCLTTLTPSVDELHSGPITKRADIVVMGAGGFPFDNSLLDAVETMPAGLNALKKGGTLIMAAECGKGHGGTEFYDWSSEHKEPRHLETRLRHRFNYNGFKASFLSRALQTHRVCLVSTIPDYYVENTFNMKSATTVNAALHSTQRTQGSDSTITVIPNASKVVPKLLEPPKH